MVYCILYPPLPESSRPAEPHAGSDGLCPNEAALADETRAAWSELGRAAALGRCRSPRPRGPCVSAPRLLLRLVVAPLLHRLVPLSICPFVRLSVCSRGVRTTIATCVISGHLAPKRRCEKRYRNALAPWSPELRAVHRSKLSVGGVGGPTNKTQTIKQVGGVGGCRAPCSACARDPPPWCAQVMQCSDRSAAVIRSRGKRHGFSGLRKVSDRSKRSHFPSDFQTQTNIRGFLGFGTNSLYVKRNPIKVEAAVSTPVCRLAMLPNERKF